MGGSCAVNKAEGQAHAFHELYLRYYDIVYAYGRMMLRDEHEAEDVTQDVFIRAFRLLPGFQTSSGPPFRVLLLRLTRNRSIDYLRRRNRWEPREPEQIDAGAERALHDDPPGAFEAISDPELDHALRRLPVGQRQVIVLRFLLDLPSREVADVIGATPQAVRNLQYRGLRSLRAALA